MNYNESPSYLLEKPFITVKEMPILISKIMKVVDDDEDELPFSRHL